MKNKARLLGATAPARIDVTNFNGRFTQGTRKQMGRDDVMVHIPADGSAPRELGMDDRVDIRSGKEQFRTMSKWDAERAYFDYVDGLPAHQQAAVADPALAYTWMVYDMMSSIVIPEKMLPKGVYVTGDGR